MQINNNSKQKITAPLSSHALIDTAKSNFLKIQKPKEISHFLQSNNAESISHVLINNTKSKSTNTYLDKRRITFTISPSSHSRKLRIEISACVTGGAVAFNSIVKPTSAKLRAHNTGELPAAQKPWLFYPIIPGNYSLNCSSTPYEPITAAGNCTLYPLDTRSSKSAVAIAECNVHPVNAINDTTDISCSIEDINWLAGDLWGNCIFDNSKSYFGECKIHDSYYSIFTHWKDWVPTAIPIVTGSIFLITYLADVCYIYVKNSGHTSNTERLTTAFKKACYDFNYCFSYSCRCKQKNSNSVQNVNNHPTENLNLVKTEVNISEV